jgi:hypothetical protein
MRVLIVTAAKEEELHRARRHLGYDRLVAVVPADPGEGLARALRELPQAEVVPVPAHDFLACFERLERVLARARAGRSHVRAAVDGGTSAMSAAAFLACLSAGVEAWFLLNRAVRLPILQARPVSRRFPEGELAVLAALDGQLTHAELARRAGLGEAEAKRALLGLRRAGAVEADAQRAALTALGAYYRRSLGPRRSG